MDTMLAKLYMYLVLFASSFELLVVSLLSLLASYNYQNQLP